jgi:hypothetical protein
MDTSNSPQNQGGYVGLGLLLVCSALTLLVTGLIQFVQSVEAGNFRAVELLDRVLPVLFIVELIYAVEISFRKHALVPDPFLLVGLDSAIRRALLLTAELGGLRENIEGGILIELAVLTMLMIAIAISLVMLRKSSPPAVVESGKGDVLAGRPYNGTEAAIAVPGSL